MDTSHFSDHLREAIELAEELEKTCKTGYVGSEHLMMGLIAVEDSAAGKLLMEAGVDKNQYVAIFKRSIDRNARIHGYTPRTKRVLELAVELSVEGGNYKALTGTEHALLAILMMEDCLAVKILKMIGTDIAALKKRTEEIALPVDENGERIKFFEVPRSAPRFYEPPDAFSSAESVPRNAQQGTLPEEVMRHGDDLTKKAREGKLDPVIGRQNEIEKVIQILSRRTKNNPVLVGEPGVGKSAVVEGLARAIVAGDVPEPLRGKMVFSLNITSMLAGTKYRGEFEERIKKVMDEIIANRDIILFIDEIHTIVGAGASADSPLDASNILKPMLARGELQTIGATTLEEYRKFIEKDPALERRFTPVTVDQPSVEDTITILHGLKDKYEAHHGIVITDEAIEAAARLSDRYITDRFLPDKAIDLIDEAASHQRLLAYTGPSELREREERLARATAERDKAAGWKDYSRAAEFSREIDTLTAEIREIKEKWSSERNSAHLSIGAEEIAAIVSSWTGVPVVKLTEAESERLMHLEEELHERIVGQEEAVTAVAKAIRRARAGLKDPNRPIGSFIFVGPTGVGKTDLCKALAESLFGDERLMIRLDMSEYMEKHSTSKLIGAPPGYVGYEDTSGTLTERIRKTPYAVVLFDEIEKAHPEVFNILLQILDDGRLTDSKGRVVSFKNTVLIMTSNVGAHQVKEVGLLGFRTAEEENEYETMKENIQEALRQKFRPEFLNRLDETIIFHKLSKEDAARICDKIIQNLQKQLKEREINIKVSNRARNKLVDEGYSEEYGARPLKRTVRKLIEDRLSEEILMGNLPVGGTVIIDEENGELTFTEE